MKKLSNVMLIILNALNIILTPVFFLKIFHDVGVLPKHDINGNFIGTTKTHYYYTPLENLKALECEYLLWVCVAFIVLSLTVFLFSFIKKERWLKTLSLIISVFTTLMLLCVITFSSTVARGY